MKRLTLVATLMAVVISTSATVQGYATEQKPKTQGVQIDMFPKPAKGYKQVYIALPKTKNDANLKVEIFVGAEKMVDCNNYFLSGAIKEMNLEGWGYTYYMAESNGQMAGTMMACPDGKTSSRFVHMVPQILRYNSKLPIVIYVPQNLEVRYRIWRADKKMSLAKQQ